MIHLTAKLSEELNRKLPARNMMLQHSTLYTNPDSHNAQSSRQTDRRQHDANSRSHCVQCAMCIFDLLSKYSRLWSNFDGSFSLRFVAKRYILQQKYQKKLMGNCLLETRPYNPEHHNAQRYRRTDRWCHDVEPIPLGAVKSTENKRFSGNQMTTTLTLTQQQYNLVINKSLTLTSCSNQKKMYLKNLKIRSSRK